VRSRTPWDHEQRAGSGGIAVALAELAVLADGEVHRGPSPPGEILERGPQVYPDKLREFGDGDRPALSLRPVALASTRRKAAPVRSGRQRSASMNRTRIVGPDIVVNRLRQQQKLVALESGDVSNPRF
jgi:hypothetical protein